MKQVLRIFIVLLCLLGISTGIAAESDAGDITIETARLSLVNDVYLMDAEITYHLSEQALQALHNSVPLTISLEIEVREPRSYLWDVRLARLRRDFRIDHHPLTDGFVIDDLITGIRQSFTSLDDTLAALGHVTQMAVVERRRLESPAHYRVFLRATLDLEALPAPLRLRAYFSSGWQLSSGWFKWDFDT
jgi:hypothetical protein